METYKAFILPDGEEPKWDNVKEVDTGIDVRIIDAIKDIREIGNNEYYLTPVMFEPVTYSAVFSVIQNLGGKQTRKYTIKIEKVKG